MIRVRDRREQLGEAKPRNPEPSIPIQGPTYSAWEAKTHIPIIKSSWNALLEACPAEKIGLMFYTEFVDVR